MDILEQAKQEITRRRRAVRLKTVIPDVESITGAERFVGIGKTLDVYSMVLNGIEVAQTVNDAITVMRSMNLLHESEIGLTTLTESARVTQLANTMEATDSVMSAGRYLFAANVLGVLTTYVGVWMSLAGAWAQAKADILTDNAKSGASMGAVLGANDAGPHYIASQNFWMRSRPSYPFFREAENAAKNIHNIAFVAGYAEGKSLSRNQKGNLFRFLHSRMTIVDQAYYTSGSWNDWSTGKKRDYYFQCAANFRMGMLK